MSRQTKITQRQRAAFWQAHHAACVNLGISTAIEREDYRKQVMREETGKEHLADLDRTGDFDKCMKRFTADAGDYETACRFAIGDDARKAAIIRVCARQILQLKGSAGDWQEAMYYLAGVVEQARIPCGRDPADSTFWMDVSPTSLLSLFQMLDTHRRRLLRGLLGDNSTFLGFDPSVSYERRDGGVRLIYGRMFDSPSVEVNVRRGEK